MPIEDSQEKQRYRSYGDLLKIIINVSLSGFNFGYCNGCFNSIDFDDIVQIFEIEEYPRAFTQGLLTGCISLTGGIGALMSKYFLKKFSRKQCYQIFGTSMIIICLLMLTRSITMLFIGRLVQGFIIGATSSINPIYIKQFSPVQLSGITGPINQIMIVIGITYTFFQTFLFSLVFSPSFYWRIVIGFPILSSAIMLYNLKYNYPYQTPKYLLLQNRKQEVRELLAIIYKQEYIEQVYDSIEDAINKQKIRQSKTSHKSLSIELQEMGPQKKSSLKEKLIKEQPHEEVQLSSNKLAVIAAFSIALQQQLAGTGVIIAYSGEIIKLCFPILSKIFPVMVHAIAFIAVFSSVVVLKYLGRRNSILHGGLSLAICLFLIARCFSNLNSQNILDSSFFIKISILLLILMLRGIFLVSIGPVSWIYTAEIVQPDIIPYTVMTSWLSVFLVNLTFPVLKEWMGGNPAHVFDLYAFFTIGFYLLNRYAMIETANKTQMQIRREYDAKWK